MKALIAGCSFFCTCGKPMELNFYNRLDSNMMECVIQHDFENYHWRWYRDTSVENVFYNLMYNVKALMDGGVACGWKQKGEVGWRQW